MINFTLQEYKTQRNYRDQKRKQYLTQFQTLRKKMGLSNLGQQTNRNVPQQVQVQSHIQQPQQPRQLQQQQQQQIVSSFNSSQHNQLVAENTQLKQQLSQIETTEKQKLQSYKNKINSAKNEYMQKIKQVNEEGMKQKTSVSQQIQKLQQQISTANNKNIEIEQFNNKLEQQTTRAEEIMLKYSKQIQQQYDQKLGQFNNVFEASSTKIQEMENEQNDEEFVNATLQNEQIVQSIKQNAENSQADIEKMLTDYTELLNGKQQITQQLSENNKMKEQEIAKMATLEQKLKDIFGKINEEKRLYGEQNARMGAELMEVKELLTKTLGGVGSIA